MKQKRTSVQDTASGRRGTDDILFLGTAAGYGLVCAL